MLLVREMVRVSDLSFGSVLMTGALGSAAFFSLEFAENGKDPVKTKSKGWI